MLNLTPSNRLEQRQVTQILMSEIPTILDAACVGREDVLPRLLEAWREQSLEKSGALFNEAATFLDERDLL